MPDFVLKLQEKEAGAIKDSLVGKRTLTQSGKCASTATRSLRKQTRESDSREYHLLYWAGSATEKRSLTMGSLPTGRVHLLSDEDALAWIIRAYRSHGSNL